MNSVEVLIVRLDQGTSFTSARRALAELDDTQFRMLRRSSAALARLPNVSGLTLVELLVTITILGILSSVVVVAVQNFSGSSLVAACTSNVRTVSGAQEAYLAEHGAYASSIDALVSANFLRSAPASDKYEIVTDASGNVTSTPPCTTASFASEAAVMEPSATTVGALATSCSAAVQEVTSAQAEYEGDFAKYASSVNTLVKKGYLDADPSTSDYTVKTTKSGAVTAKPACDNLSVDLCNIAVHEVEAAQASRLAQLGKYASNVAQLVKGGYLDADPSTDAYKITTNKQGTVAAAPECSTFA